MVKIKEKANRGERNRRKEEKNGREERYKYLH
jgi:hypothetical protein